MRSLKDLMQSVTNIKLALHFDGKLSKILRLLLYVKVMLYKLEFFNLHQTLEVYIGAQYA